jgi:uncharacterized FlaG/YvyC family protein
MKVPLAGNCPASEEKIAQGPSFSELLKTQVRQPQPRVPPESPAAHASVAPADPYASSLQLAATQLKKPDARLAVTSRALMIRCSPRSVLMQPGRQAASASRRTEKVLARAHAQSAQANQGRIAERMDDRVRVCLFQRLERECVKPTALADREPQQERSPSAEPISVAAVQSRVEPPPQPQASTSSQRAEAIAELVERIDVALKSGQPTISLGLSSESGASSIQISRTGKGEVSVRIKARAGKREAFGAGDQLREALQARGLRVKNLTIV